MKSFFTTTDGSGALAPFGSGSEKSGYGVSSVASPGPVRLLSSAAIALFAVSMASSVVIGRPLRYRPPLDSGMKMPSMIRNAGVWFWMLTVASPGASKVPLP